MRRLNHKTGFTILELALAMAFISFLLLAIGLVTVQISRVYQKGITIKVVNNNGRELVDEFTRTILASKYDPSADSNGLEHYEYTFSMAEMPISETDNSPVQAHGSFCTGRYSYMWNTGYALSSSLSQDLVDNYRATFSHYADPDNPDNATQYENFRLLRISDPGREVCINYADEVESNTSTHVTNYHASSKATNVVELLPASESELVFYDFIVYKPAYHSGSGDALFSASFILGTISSGVDILASGNFCTDPPEGFNTDFIYCSINKFNFAARATGGLAL